jgi:acyl carrier protein
MQLKESNSPSNDVNNAVETIQQWLVTQIAKQLNTKAQSIKVSEQLTRYGLDSIDSVTIVGEMEDWLGTELPSTLLWDYPTIEKAAQYLASEMGISPTATLVSEPVAAASTSAPSTSKGWDGLWKRIGGS